MWFDNNRVKFTSRGLSQRKTSSKLRAGPVKYIIDKTTSKFNHRMTESRLKKSVWKCSEWSPPWCITMGQPPVWWFKLFKFRSVTLQMLTPDVSTRKYDMHFDHFFMFIWTKRNFGRHFLYILFELVALYRVYNQACTTLRSVIHSFKLI
jgi:hypothetical protein